MYGKGRSSTKQKEHAIDFLKNAGVKVFNERAIIELSLAYYRDRPKVFNNKRHLSDIQRYVRYWKNNPNDLNLFRRMRFLRGRTWRTGADYWCGPQDLFLDNGETGQLSSVTFTKGLIYGMATRLDLAKY